MKCTLSVENPGMARGDGMDKRGRRRMHAMQQDRSIQDMDAGGNNAGAMVRWIRRWLPADDNQTESLLSVPPHV